jgi:pimeloyl-ACP methyl ester carboxylesterase
MPLPELDLQANGLRFAAHERGSGDKLALLLHGFPDDAGSMLPLAERMADAGYRVVVPFMRGYGPTESPPDGDYQLASLAADVIGLIDALGAEEAYVVGHDWGAVASYAAVNLAPERISRFAALSVPPPRTIEMALKNNLDQLRRSWYMMFFQLPFVPERVLPAMNFAFIDKLWRDWSPGWDYPRERIDGVKATFRSPGTVSAALGYYRSFSRVWKGGLDGYKRSRELVIRRFNVPGLVLAGEQDGCMGLPFYETAVDCFEAPARFETIPGAGHFLPMEATDAVADAILSFFKDDLIWVN